MSQVYSYQIKARVPKYDKADRERWCSDLIETHTRRGENARRKELLAAARNSGDPLAALEQFLKEGRDRHGR